METTVITTDARRRRRRVARISPVSKRPRSIEVFGKETGCCSFQKGGVREENAEERDGGAAKIDERLPNCARFCNGDGPGRILGFSSTGRLFEARNFIGLRFLTPASGFVFKEGSHCNFTSLQSFVSWLLRGDPSDVNREHASVDIELRVWSLTFCGSFLYLAAMCSLTTSTLFTSKTLAQLQHKSMT
nr:uncharacterized protein LOC112290287 isoform X1 [Physcomitrium patens]|eukprot:XP_024392189.1 uncharacterized protein LOC112290287 isoform X1 [Physcomitrella patens]